VASGFRIYGLPLKVPRPGSLDARGRGCTCPEVANQKGQGWEVSEEATRRGFWIDTGCPLHGLDAHTAEKSPPP